MTPDKLEEEARKRRLENALKEVEVKYAEPNAQQSLATGSEELKAKRLANAIAEKYGMSEKEADILVKKAQAKHYEDQAAGRTFAPSALGKLVQERNDLAAKNPNDPLIAEYDRVIKAQGAGKSYAPSGLGKLANELREVEEGFLPGSNGSVPLTPDQQDNLRNQYLLKMQQTTTDSVNREQVIKGQNLLKSQEESNIDALTRYAGPTGAAKLAAAKAKALAGHPSEEYLEYVEAQAAAEIEVDEYRDFLKTSITPETRKALQDLINPHTFLLSPEEAKRKIQKARDTIKKQVQTRIDALQNPQTYITGSAQSPKKPSVPNEFSAAIKNAENPPKLFGSLQLEDDGSQ
jgi:hypothetical protein